MRNRSAVNGILLCGIEAYTTKSTFHVHFSLWFVSYIACMSDASENRCYFLRVSLFIPFHCFGMRFLVLVCISCLWFNCIVGRLVFSENQRVRVTSRNRGNTMQCRIWKFWLCRTYGAWSWRVIDTHTQMNEFLLHALRIHGYRACWSSATEPKWERIQVSRL